MPRPSAPVPERVGSPTPWPADAIDGVHGWLALGSGTEAAPAPWGRITASEPAVVLGPWDVPPDTTVRALLPTGPVPLVVRPREVGRYGCDGGHEVDVVPLAGASAAGMIWVVSPTFPAAGLPLASRDDDTGRIWAFGDHTAGLKKVGTYEAELWYGSPPVVVERFDVSKDRMSGAELTAVDTTGSTLVPQASAAWQVGDVTVLGLYRDSYEGVHFDALVVRDGAARLYPLGYMYQCAF